MFNFAAVLALASTALPIALAHGGVIAYSNGGNWFQGWAAYTSPTGQTTIQRPWATYNPITDATDPTLACNDDGTSGALQLTATVKAGSDITAYWNQWGHPSGPMLTYLAECPGSSCTGVNANILKWFKIDESGLISGTVGNGLWGAGKMIADNSSWTTTIPSSVPSGNYLIRFETIALHAMPAQFYPECAQLSITGGGNRAPTTDELVSFPGAYSNDDPGLNIDIYARQTTTQTTYVIPGPPLYGSGSGSPAPAPTAAPSNAAPSASPSSAAPAAPSNAAPSASPSSAPPAAGTVAQFGQCGGQGFTGDTGCVAPFKCTAVNAYYSQCL